MLMCIPHKFQQLITSGNGQVSTLRPVALVNPNATVEPNATVRPTPVIIDATDKATKELEREVNLLRNWCYGNCGPQPQNTNQAFPKQ